MLKPQETEIHLDLRKIARMFKANEMASPHPLRFIHRIDYGKTHSWHVMIRRRNRLITRHFTDGVHGGKCAAFKAAIAFRDAVLKEHHNNEYRVWLRLKRPTNTSGTTGVGRYTTRKVQGGRVVERAHWRAFWTDQLGGKHSRAFLVSKYGEDRARALAAATRRSAMKRIFGRADLICKLVTATDTAHRIILGGCDLAR